jgi:hypothetical protein
VARIFRAPQEVEEELEQEEAEYQAEERREAASGRQAGA